MFHLCCHFLKRLGISVPPYQQLLTPRMPRMMVLRAYCMASIHLPLESYPMVPPWFFSDRLLFTSALAGLDPSCCEPLVPCTAPGWTSQELHFFGYVCPFLQLDWELMWFSAIIYLVPFISIFKAWNSARNRVGAQYMMSFERDGRMMSLLGCQMSEPGDNWRLSSSGNLFFLLGHLHGFIVTALKIIAFSGVLIDCKLIGGKSLNHSESKNHF